MVKDVNFCCPKCKGDLTSSNAEFMCGRCDQKYPVVLGIPDFRVFQDPYITIEDDYKKAEHLLNQSKKMDFKGLVRHYWEITPEVSRDRAERFMRRTFALVEKGNKYLKAIEIMTSYFRPLTFGTVLEIGCGTGGFLVAANDRFSHVIGMDIAFRWLVIARKRLEEKEIDLSLVCACAEYMPFREDSFDLIVAENVLEHVNHQEKALRDCYRVMKNDGTLFLATPNRFSVSPEPHVRVWGVGFLPRKWMNAYVKAIKGISYENLKVLSVFELKNLLIRSRFPNHQVILPAVSKEEMREFSPFEKTQVAIYEAVKRIPVIGLILYLFGPFFHVIGYAEKCRNK